MVPSGTNFNIVPKHKAFVQAKVSYAKNELPCVHVGLSVAFNYMGNVS